MAGCQQLGPESGLLLSLTSLSTCKSNLEENNIITITGTDSVERLIKMNKANRIDFFVEDELVAGFTARKLKMDINSHLCGEENPFFMAFKFFENLFCQLGVIPEIGVKRLLFFIFYLVLTFIDVKDTSLTKEDVCGDPAVVLPSS